MKGDFLSLNDRDILFYNVEEQFTMFLDFPKNIIQSDIALKDFKVKAFLPCIILLTLYGHPNWHCKDDFIILFCLLITIRFSMLLFRILPVGFRHKILSLTYFLIKVVFEFFEKFIAFLKHYGTLTLHVEFSGRDLFR